MMAQARKLLCFILLTASWTYLTALFIWLILHRLTGDRLVIVSLLEFLAVYLFFPLPVLFGITLLCRSRALAIGAFIGALAFIWHWGALFTPRLESPNPRGHPLAIMTFNVLAWHDFTEPILETIRHEDADVVFIQELNANLARALKAELSDVYPYQILEPIDDPRGIGTISKYPIRVNGRRLMGHWVGAPQILEMEWEGRTVTLVNFHMTSMTAITPRSMVLDTLRWRAIEAQQLANLATQSTPAILAGDANCTSWSRPYRILTSELIDSWQEAGFGLGHTFPGSDIPGSDRPHLGDWYVPQWLARIDYIFHTEEWETLSARLAQVDGVSDHRGVIAVLALR